MHPLDEALQHSIEGRPEESERILRTLPQDDPRVIFNLGWHEMRHGRLKEGLRMMDAGRFINCFGNPRIPGEIWRDQDLNGKTLLFRCEGGFGDQIMNFRFAYQFQKMGARVVVSCSRELMGLFSRNGLVCMNQSAIPHLHYDYWVPSMSASHMLDSKCVGVPYLQFPARIPFDQSLSSIRVGIRWSGNPQFEHEQHRRFDPQLMIALANMSRGTFYSLQRDDGVIDNLPFTDLRDKLTTWEDTAAIVSSLDLVITSCTSIAHLAGALGVRTWVVVPRLPYYCWSVPGEKSQWYDSVRIFRQPASGDWTETFQQVRTELEDLCTQ